MSDSEPAPVNILLVDDHPANLVALEAVLEPLGQHLEHASSGSQAIEKLLAKDFALVLMDVQMPGLDGFQTVEAIRSREELKHIPVIFVTARSRDDRSAATGYALGAVDFIVKPFDPEVMRAKVSAFVALHQRNAEISARLLAEQASRTREEFVAILGHDLRGPLNVILLSAERWEQHPDPGVPTACRDAARRIRNSAARMEALIQACLDLTRSRLGTGIYVEPEPADMAALCQVPVEELRTIHRERAIEFEVEGDVHGRWDPRRVTQVAANLLDNAVKYSNGSGQPVRLALRGEDGQVLMMVHNDGPPIPAGIDLFEPFKGGARKREGLGLGLYIVDQIVRAHGGSIAVASSADAGTQFTIRWPR